MRAQGISGQRGLCFASLAVAGIAIVSWNGGFATATMESYISEVDGSQQPFGLYLPEPFDPDVPHPVVLHLHAGGQRADTTFPNAAYANARGWIMVKPDARGPYPPYLGVTENDPLRVLEEVRARFKVDENRIYSMGTCSGASGSVSFAFTYPDVFAAIGAVDGRYELFRFHANWCSPIGDLWEVHPARLPLLEGLSPYDVAENAEHVRVYLGVDTGDATVPPECGYELHNRLNELGYAHSYHLFPGGHTEGYNPSEIYEFLSPHVRDPNPQQVILKANQLIEACVANEMFI